MTTPPVIFLVFNRPEPTARVLARLREARPERLFVVADGPRPDRPGEAEKCRRVRDMIERGVDWPCEVIRDYSEVNLGCARRVSSGITNAFRVVEEAIILEDDCLPDPTFFPYCTELLERYRDEPRVGVIGGSNHQYRDFACPTSYYFSVYNHVWGWATWRRAWNCFDYSMPACPGWESDGLERWLSGRSSAGYWRRIFSETRRGLHDSWAYRWTYACWRAGMLSVLPRRPLIMNLGFGADATHTRNRFGAGLQPPVDPMRFPMVHPERIEADAGADEHTESVVFTRPSLWSRLVGRLARLGWRNA